VRSLVLSEKRHVWYCVDVRGLNSLIKHVGDEVLNCRVLRMPCDERSEVNIHYKPPLQNSELDCEVLEEPVRSFG